tara:strand:- start:8873 stop:9601 length:729 start_codon:yes stop_codon:yes gene_type:complete
MACNKETLSFAQIKSLVAIMKARGYIVYTEPYRLNIVGVRNPSPRPESFDDNFFVFFKDNDGKWIGYKYTGTTDPSTSYLNKGGFKDSTTGIAIVPQGQYVDTYSIGLHNGKYEALVQEKPFCIYRDYNRDDILNFNVEDKVCGDFGINIHRAMSGGAEDGKGNTLKVGVYSAGCQVFNNYYCWLEFMEMARKHRGLYGNYFTYTLLDKSLRNKFLLKRSIVAAVVGLGIFLTIFGIKKLKK